MGSDLKNILSTCGVWGDVISGSYEIGEDSLDWEKNAQWGIKIN